MPHHYGNSHALRGITEMTFHLYPSQLKLVLNLATLDGCKAELM